MMIQKFLNSPIFSNMICTYYKSDKYRTIKENIVLSFPSFLHLTTVALINVKMSAHLCSASALY